MNKPSSPLSSFGPPQHDNFPVPSAIRFHQSKKPIIVNSNRISDGKGSTIVVRSSNVASYTSVANTDKAAEREDNVHGKEATNNTENILSKTVGRSIADYNDDKFEELHQPSTTGDKVYRAFLMTMCFIHGGLGIAAFCKGDDELC
jgi:hypothetical protein